MLLQKCWNLASAKRLEKWKIKNVKVYSAAKKLTQNRR